MSVPAPQDQACPAVRVAAFFDMDRTVLSCNSGALWVRYLRRRREMSRIEALRALRWLVEYKFAVLDFEGVTDRLVAGMAGTSEAELRKKCHDWYAEEVHAYLVPAARERVERHRQGGHLVVLLSSSSPYVTEPLARELRLDAVLCTRLEVEGDRFTGRVRAPACYGRGKVYWAEQYAREQGVDLLRSYFYTDSYSDLPMLERVGQPVVVNPDPRLRRHARRAGWETETW
jgi:HAD superfamily hydrolase (TIGR01490 family)